MIHSDHYQFHRLGCARNILDLSATCTSTSLLGLFVLIFVIVNEVFSTLYDSVIPVSLTLAVLKVTVVPEMSKNTVYDCSMYSG